MTSTIEGELFSELRKVASAKKSIKEISDFMLNLALPAKKHKEENDIFHIFL